MGGLKCIILGCNSHDTLDLQHDDRGKAVCEFFGFFPRDFICRAHMFLLMELMNRRKAVEADIAADREADLRSG